MVFVFFGVCLVVAAIAFPVATSRPQYQNLIWWSVGVLGVFAVAIAVMLTLSPNPTNLFGWP